MITKEQAQIYLRKAKLLSIKQNNCLIMQSNFDKDGYGQLTISQYNKNPIRIIRIVAYLNNKLSSLADELKVRHTCHVSACIENEHLITGTQADNIQDMLDAKRHPNQCKTHCKHGHEFTPENTRTFRRPFRNPERQCITCVNNRHKTRKLNQKGL